MLVITILFITYFFRTEFISLSLSLLDKNVEKLNDLNWSKNIQRNQGER